MSVSRKSEHAPQIYSTVPAILPPDQLFGPLFHDVQMQHVFNDSIIFADSFPKRSPEEILSLYEIQKHDADFSLLAFIETYFEIPKQVDTGYVSNRSLPTAEHIQKLWPLLTQQYEPNSSLLPLPKPYSVPGGRFRGLYYWDSFFAMLGLRIAGDIDSIRDMVENFAYLIDAYGHIPNANRSYYLSRSQPPFFALMVRLLGDIDGPDVLVRYLPQLQKEYNYWMDGYFRLNDYEVTFRRVVRLPDGCILNRYWDDLAAPRPESYAEDVELANYAAAYGVTPGILYRHIRAACESGWDFSSRWFGDPTNMATIHTTDMIPVDLNSLLYYLEETLSLAYRQSSFTAPSDQFARKAEERKKAIMAYCWDPRQAFFLDHHLGFHKLSGIWSLAGIFPLFVGLASQEQATAVHEHIKSQFLKDGGVVTSIHQSGQQWDSPNGWAPLQWLTCQGLLRYGFRETAAEISRRWRALNDRVYRDSGKMMEKYDVVNLGEQAGGGEYPNQDGFGWTNGVYIDLETHVNDDSPDWVK
ncbi:alpha,alpha-trehalase TreA [Spirosoma sp. KUDC1026]|uniref:alpha,alpha-trehalase TreA n=1 Tax=Spirosoma sp. KUDC1026 TaxID=2745947 RepID=UPI00159BE768|nr:alpha,alpha-trehalase TreA [Spirosoma sp. KUDC1026]QKZ13917.1 alpha,alpha-trehalase TreA [Spirosoma sp. KUDC1026]